MFDMSKITELQKLTGKHNNEITPIIEYHVRQYTKDLDNFILEYGKQISNTENTISNKSLDEMVMNLPKLIYWASEGQEILNVEAELAKTVKNEKFIESLKDKTGNVSHRNMEAELETINETINYLIFVYASNRIKNKINYAMELLQSAKKIVSKRMNDNEWDAPYKTEVKQTKERKKVF